MYIKNSPIPQVCIDTPTPPEVINHVCEAAEQLIKPLKATGFEAIHLHITEVTPIFYIYTVTLKSSTGDAPPVTVSSSTDCYINV